MCYRKQYDRDNSLMDNLPETEDKRWVPTNGLFNGPDLVNEARAARAWKTIDWATNLIVALGFVFGGFAFILWLFGTQ